MLFAKATEKEWQEGSRSTDWEENIVFSSWQIVPYDYGDGEIVGIRNHFQVGGDEAWFILSADSSTNSLGLQYGRIACLITETYARALKIMLYVYEPGNKIR